MGGMIKCSCCGSTLHSIHRHDFQQCRCIMERYVDGGEEYMRVGGKHLDAIIVVGHVHLAGNLGVMLTGESHKMGDKS